MTAGYRYYRVSLAPQTEPLIFGLVVHFTLKDGGAAASLRKGWSRP